MNVIILNDVWQSIPMRSLGAYKIAHTLRNVGITVQVIDFISTLSGSELFELIKLFKTNSTSWIGLSTTFIASDIKSASGATLPSNTLPKNLTEALTLSKQAWPTINTVIGGAKSDNFNDDTYNLFDYGILGYGEHDVVHLHNYITTGTNFPQIVKSKINCKFVSWANIPSTYDIKHDNFLWNDNDCIQPHETLPLETARGCIFKCKFCAFQEIGKKKGDSVRSMACVIKELTHNYNKWGVTRYYMLDDTFNDDPNKIEEFTKVVNSLPFKIEFTAYIRCDLLARFPKSATHLKEAGIKSAFFGIESMHPEASRLIGKAWNGTESARNFIKDLRENIWGNDVNIFTSHIVGLVPESKDSILETAEWLNDINIHQFKFRQLSLRSNPVAFASEFEKNHIKYGYTFISLHNKITNGYDGEWQNLNISGLETVNECHALAEQINTKYNKRHLISSWGLLAHGTLGYDINHILNTKTDNPSHWVEVRSRSAQWKRTYYDSLTKLSTKL